jgi:hypothetical protein
MSIALYVCVVQLHSQLHCFATILVGTRRASFTLERTTTMPGTKHLRGVGSKEQRQYEHIKQSAEKTGRYGGRAKEVAARTVLKQHKEKGHSKGE